MATDDVQRLVTGTAAAPAHFKVPGNGQIQPKTIYAHYDGTGAAGTFKPALKIISDGGETVGIYPTSTPVTAGGSVDVSWFPHVGGATATLSNPGLMAGQVQLAGDYAITKGDPGTVIVWTGTTYDNGTPTPFWDPSHPKRLTAPVNGIYASFINPIWDFGSGTITDGQHATYIYKNTETIGITTSFQKQNTPIIGSTAYFFPGAQHGVFELLAGDYIILNAYMNDPSDPAGTTHWIDLRTHVGQPKLFSSWSLVLMAATA